MMLLSYGPARRAGPDGILNFDLARTVREKNEVNFWSKLDVNLIYSSTTMLESPNLTAIETEDLKVYLNEVSGI